MIEQVILAGGCFWCIESAFNQRAGILSTRCGYTGGKIPHPTYEQVCQGKTGHVEAVEITFDPEKITFLQVLDIFWHHIDPLDAGGQFFDRGTQYHSTIFYFDNRQKALAEKSKKEIQTLFQEPIATTIEEAKTFYEAEEYHQSYCTKQPEHYKRYRDGHIERLKSLWEDKTSKKPSKDDLKEKLTPLQYYVTQEKGTEAPFENEYCHTKQEGIYVDKISKIPLFGSFHKFDSGTGWPSFTQPLNPEWILEVEDSSHGMHRIEVRSKSSNAHLGHVFPDGPPPTRRRYCLNSAALDFIPKEKMSEEGYGDYLSLFES